MQLSKPLRVAAGLLGLFFLVSGIGKALAIGQFVATIVAYGFPHLRILAPFIVAAEIGLGIGLLLQVQVRRLALASALLLAGFTALFAYGYLRHGVAACGCFGAFEALQTPPWVSFVRNGALLLVAGWLYRAVPPQAVAVSWPKRALIGGATLGTLVAAGYLYLHRSAEPEIFVAPSQVVRTSALAPFCPPDAAATYLVFIFSPTCSHCWAATNTVLAYQRSGVVQSIVALCPPTTAQEQQKYVRHFAPPFRIRTVAGAELLTITNQVPTAVLVRHDTIAAVLHAHFPSPDSLRLLLGGHPKSAALPSAPIAASLPPATQP